MNFEKFSERARGFVQAAQTIALREGNQRVLPEHLLKALLDDDQGMAAGLIEKAGGDAKAARQAVDPLPEPEGPSSGSAAEADRLEQALADEEALGAELFRLVQLARRADLDPERALRRHLAALRQGRR